MGRALLNEDGWTSVTGFATLAGVDKKTVLQAAKMGYFESHARNHGTTMRIHIEKAREAWARNCPNGGSTSEALRKFLNLDDPKSATQEEEHMDRPEANRRRAVAEARLAEMELQEREGKLMEVDLVRERQARWASELRKGLQAIAGKIAGRLAATDSPSECVRIVDTEINETLEAFADPRHILKIFGDQ